MAAAGEAPPPDTDLTGYREKAETRASPAAAPGFRVRGPGAAGSRSDPDLQPQQDGARGGRSESDCSVREGKSQSECTTHRGRSELQCSAGEGRSESECSVGGGKGKSECSIGGERSQSECSAGGGRSESECIAGGGKSESECIADGGKSESECSAAGGWSQSGCSAGGGRSQSECSAGGGRSQSEAEQQQRVERSPSFTSEWDEIEKIMNLIGAGIESSNQQQPSSPADGGARAAVLDQTVGEWLEAAGLPQYESKLLLNGFDDLRYMGSNVMEDSDLRDMGITDPGHRKKILHAAKNLPKVKALGCDGSTSLSSWLDVLGLQEYLPNFLSSGYRTLDCVKNLWELEIVNVLKIGPLGHRKRIIASLAERPYEEAPSKSHRLSQIRFQDLLSQGPAPLGQLDPSTSRSMDLLLPLTEAGAGRRRRGLEDWRRGLDDCSVSLRSYSERPRSTDRQSERPAREPRLTLRPPSQSAPHASVPSWHHQPEKLVLESCGYEASYLGSMIIRDLRGIESTQEACAKIRKSKDSRKGGGPVVILSITYKGVRFIDAASKTIVAEHEIRNISCAAQDPDDLCTFAYITKDLGSGHHFCHVFTTVEVTQTYEIILTLGQAFEVAYQIALQARARQYVPPPSLGSEVIETKASRPVSQSWSSMRRTTGAPLLECRCCYCHSCTTHRPSFLPLNSTSPGVQIDPLEMDADMQSLGSTTWLFDPRDSSRRPGSTNLSCLPRHPPL